jgi:hypothetical protein
VCLKFPNLRQVSEEEWGGGGGRGIPELHNDELTDPRQNIFLGDEFRGGDVVSMKKQQPPWRDQ